MKNKKLRADDYFLIDKTIINPSSDLPKDFFSDEKSEHKQQEKIEPVKETVQKTADENDFIASLNNLTVNQIPKAEKQPVKIKKSMLPNLIRLTVLIVCTGVFVYSATQIVFSYTDSLKSKQIQYELQNQFYKNSALAVPNQSLKIAKTLTLTEMLGADSDGIKFIPPELLSEYQKITKNLRDTLSSGKFPDGFAWVKVDGTRIDHLVMLGKDNKFYLDHAEDRSYNEAGSVFADYKTNKNDYLANRNLVLYAHNRSNGAMFGTIPSFFNSNDRWNLFSKTEIQVVTKDALYIYKPFAAYITSGAHYINYHFPTDESWTDFMQEALDSSIFTKWTTGYKKYIKPNANLLTFSTCTNNFIDVNERYVLHAVLVDVIKDTDT